MVSVFASLGMAPRQAEGTAPDPTRLTRQLVWWGGAVFRTHENLDSQHLA